MSERRTVSASAWRPGVGCAGMPSMAHALRCPSLTPTDSLKMRSRTFAPPSTGLNNGGIDWFTGQVLANTMTVVICGIIFEVNGLGLLRRSNSQKTIQAELENHIAPRWAHVRLDGSETVMVEQWLMSVKRLDGKMMSRESKSKVRNTLSGLFTHALRWEFCSSNPISCGGTNISKGGKRGTGTGRASSEGRPETQDYPLSARSKRSASSLRLASATVRWSSLTV